MSEKELENTIRRVVREELAAREAGQGGGAELLTIAEAAALRRVGVTTIRKWMKSGTLKRYGEGRCVRVSRAELLGMRGPNKSDQVDPDSWAGRKLRGI